MRKSINRVCNWKKNKMEAEGKRETDGNMEIDKKQLSWWGETGGGKRIYVFKSKAFTELEIEKRNQYKVQ